MAHRLSMDKVQAIQHLRSLGWSLRRIAESLGVDRKAVRRHLRLPDAKGTQAPTGEAPTGSPISKGTQAPTGSDEIDEAAVEEAPTGGRAAPPRPGRSECEPFRETILEMLRGGLHARRVYQDLVADHGFAGRYWSVRRFVRTLRRTSEPPFRRIEVEPGEEAQIDFGVGAKYTDHEGRRRKCHVLRVVLSHSRKGYSEVVPRQTTECFIRALENAFHHFGGVPRTLNIDNLRAAVTKADWYDPELNRKVLSFCEHYGTVMLPCRPRTPRHKGKVERGIDYVQENALRGRVFESLAAENEALLRWETTVADTRIHGTTKRHVGRHFLEVERTALRALPPSRFPFFKEGRRKVGRDGHVEVEGAYYSLPPEYLGRTVWARWDSRLVRLFDHEWRQVAVHVRVERGRFSTPRAHIASEKISGVERGAAYLLGKAGEIGPLTARWAESMLTSRGVAGVRVLLGLLSLAKRHPEERIERACDLAWRQQLDRLRSIRALLARDVEPPRQELMFELTEDHPLIRPLSEYQRIVHNAIQEGAGQ